MSPAMRPSLVTIITRFSSSMKLTSTRAMLESYARAARVGAPDQVDLVGRRDSDGARVRAIVVGRLVVHDVDGRRRVAARGDARRRVRRAAHRVAVEIFGVRVADGVALDDADADALRRAAARGLHRLLLERDVRAFAMLEEQLGVLAAAAHRHAEQVGGDAVVDAVAVAEERLGQPSGISHAGASGSMMSAGIDPS